jgi:anti-sigma-K factor RskA
MDHEDYKELLPVHALSALDREEARALEEHLTGCADCGAELDAWRATAGALAYAAQPLQPSAQLRDRILASVRAETESSRTGNVIPLVRGTGRPPGSLLWFPEQFAAWQAIAAAVIFLGLIIGVVTFWQRNRVALAEIARLSAQMAETRGELDREHAALEFFARPGMRMAELAGTKDAPAAHAMLAVDSKSGQAMLMAKGLPQAPAGKAYQLWFIAGTRPIPGKVFKPDAAGNAMMSEQLPASALNAATFAVTLEPQNGVTAPTGSMYLLTPAPIPS